MAHQAKMNDAPQHDPQSDALAQHLAAIAQDLDRIAGLQRKLLAVDLRMLRNRIVGGLTLWIVAICLFAAALPVALSGIGLYLAHVAEIRDEAGLLWVAFASAVLVLALGAWGWLLLSKQWAPFRRSCNEFRETVKTLSRSLSLDSESRE